MASSVSTTWKMRAPTTISSPRRPAGYPEPSHFSWCWRTIDGRRAQVVDALEERPPQLRVALHLGPLLRR